MNEGDVEMVRSWRNHPDVRKFMYTTHVVSRDEHADWFDRCSKDPDRHLLIFERDGKASGFTGLHRIAAGEIAEWGFYVAPGALPGSGAKMGCRVLDHAFENLQFHKLCGQAIAFNERSSDFHVKLGFRREGVLIEQHHDGRQYHDVHCFGLLANEWKENRKIF